MQSKSLAKSQNVEILNAVFTPMHSDETVNFSRIPDLFAHSIQTGSQGIFLNGSTGECMSLSLPERLQLAEAWFEQREKINRPDFKIFVHVGGCNLLEAAQMAEQAQALGAEGVAMVPAFYFRPGSIEDLIKQCEFVAAAARNTPFYYYNIPVFTGVDFPMSRFMELATKRIPNFAGLKNSAPEIVDYQHCLKMASSSQSLFWGIDEAFMMLYTAGNRHYVGSTYNYMGGLYHQMLDRYKVGDFDRVIEMERDALAIYKAMEPFNGISAGKMVMRFVGMDCGPVRRPLPVLSEVDSKMLLQNLSKTNFFKQLSLNGSAAVA